MPRHSITSHQAEKQLRYRDQIRRLVAKATKAGMDPDQIQICVNAGIAKGEVEIAQREKLERQREGVQIMRRPRR